MAPGTRIGAAHPVQVGGLPLFPTPPGAPPAGEKEPADQAKPAASPLDQKLVNDTEAWARGLAHLRGRNAEWAALAVRESRVLLADEAVREGIVELEAVDVTELLQKLDGRQVSVGRAGVLLRTAGAQLRTLDMWWGERLLAVISNPNVVILLLMFGVYGVLFELYSPGWGVAGTLGVISLVLAFFGLSVLPVNYAGLALIIMALAMFVAEVKVTSFGALTLGGVMCLILGAMMLVDSPAGFLRVSLDVVVPIAVATGLITVFLVHCIVRAHRSQVQTGGEALLGSEARATRLFEADEGTYRGAIFVHGELWGARSTEPIAEGAVVYVTARKGLTLEVALAAPRLVGSPTAPADKQIQRG
jgi:membrane-bound serine protease (ClpP class)